MGGFFNRLYYGKAGKADYTPDDLPSNRFQLFFEVLRVRFWSLCRVNLMQVVFWLPVIVWTYINVLALQGIDVQMVEAGEEALLGLRDQLLSLVQTYLFILFPLVAITGPSSAGAAYVTRNWARDQHSFVWSDFKDAMRDNWKQALVVSAITGALPLVAFVGFVFYGQMAQQSVLFYVPQVLLTLMCILWTLMLPLLYPLMVGYKLRLRDLLRNGLLLAMARLPQMVAVRLLTAIPLIVLCVGLWMNAIVALVAVAYYLFFGHAMARLVYASVANGFFDRYINPHIEGAQVGRGLRHDDDDDDDGDAGDAGDDAANGESPDA